MGVLVALMQPRVASALSAQAVGQTAKQITVLIESDNQNQGSGIIIKHSSSTYYVLTALHVVEQKAHYTITTVDGKHYALDQALVKKLATGVDLAIVQFNSSVAYQVAKIGNSDQATEGATVYVAGYALKTAVVPSSIYRFYSGQVTANASQALPGGYALIYSDTTLAGMSGGPVLNENGEVVGVHGEIANYNSALRLALKNAQAYNDRGFLRYEQGDRQGAIADYNSALRLNPNLDLAYTNRGLAYRKQGNYTQAIADFDQVLKLKPNFAPAYYNKACAYSLNREVKAAIENLQRAVDLDVKLRSNAKTDSNFDNIRQDKQFQVLVGL